MEVLGQFPKISFQFCNCYCCIYVLFFFNFLKGIYKPFVISNSFEERLNGCLANKTYVNFIVSFPVLNKNVPYPIYRML